MADGDIEAEYVDDVVAGEGLGLQYSDKPIY